MSSPLAGSFDPADRIVVPVQGTDREFLAQQWAVEFAAALGVPVHALHVATPDEEADAASAAGPEAVVGEGAGVFDFLRGECAKWGVKLETRVAHGSGVVDELIDELKSRDLVVIGTRHLAGKYHVGSVAADLVRRAPCPVQIVRLG